MRFLHTADWHLGRILHGHSLLEDQRHALQQLIDLSTTLRPDAILVAGDVYDRAVPPHEAVSLMDEVVHRIVRELGIPMVVIAGNHDSGERLGFGARLLGSSGLHLAGPVAAALSFKNATAAMAVSQTIPNLATGRCPELRGQDHSHRGSVFLCPRFDRTLDGSRIHAISGRTLTIAEQNTAPEMFSYTVLAEAIRQRGAAPEVDCRELYRRMVFNILIENTDDHEKNHAFLLTESGWRLSPSFDALPQGLGMGFQSMAINSQGQTAANTQAILSAAPAFLLSQPEAREVAAEVANAVSSWRVTFAECGVIDADIDTLATFIDSPSLRSIREELRSSPTPRLRARSRRP